MMAWARSKGDSLAARAHSCCSASMGSISAADVPGGLSDGGRCGAPLRCSRVLLKDSAPPTPSLPVDKLRLYLTEVCKPTMVQMVQCLFSQNWRKGNGQWRII